MKPGPVEIRHKLPPLKALTSLRFFAAIYVVLFHAEIGFGLTNHPWLVNFMRSGKTGVTFFFVLSGFILAYNYSQVTDRKSFWIARFARIYPVYFLSLCLFAVRPLSWWEPHAVAGALLAFGLVQAFWPPLYSTFNPVAWTLSVEAFFYAVFPFLLPWIRRMRRREFFGLQLLYLLLTCVPLGLSAFHREAGGAAMIHWIEGPFPLFRLNTFLVGVYCGVHQARPRERRADGMGQRSSRRWMLAGGLAGSAVLLCSPNPMNFNALRTQLLGYTFLLVILGLAEVRWPILTNHWMQMGGEISYGVYILQLGIGLAYFGLQRRLFPALAPSFSLYVIVLIAIAYAVFRWFEVPARLAIRRALTGRPVATRSI